MTEAARSLGLSRASVYRHMPQMGGREPRPFGGLCKLFHRCLLWLPGLYLDKSD